MAKIYLASSWRNEKQPAVLAALIEAGHEVYDFRNPSPKDKGFDWADIDRKWKTWTVDQYRQALAHSVARKGFLNDFNAMKQSDICVLLLPSGRSAHSEAGWMKGANKNVYVITQDSEEPELMYKMFDGVFSSVEELIDLIGVSGFPKAYFRNKEVSNG